MHTVTIEVGWLPAWLEADPSPASGRMRVAADQAEAPGEEDALVVAAREGDEGAFTELVRRHAGRISRLVARFARSRTDLEEIAQDVFIEMHRSLARYDGRAPFEHWLCRIATRRCYDHLRRLYRRRWLGSLDALLSAGYEPEAEPLTTSDDPRVEALRAAIRRLPPAQQTIITLLELEEHSVREIAALTGWSEGNVKVRAHRAREALRRILSSGSVKLSDPV